MVELLVVRALVFPFCTLLTPVFVLLEVVLVVALVFSLTEFALLKRRELLLTPCADGKSSCTGAPAGEGLCCIDVRAGSLVLLLLPDWLNTGGLILCGPLLVVPLLMGALTSDILLSTAEKDDPLPGVGLGVSRGKTPKLGDRGLHVDALRCILPILAWDCLEDRGALGTVKGVIMLSGVIVASLLKSGVVRGNGLIPDN